VPEPGETPIRVKICGVRRPEDARHAALAGADYVGAILSPGFGRSVEPEAAARFLDGLDAVLVAVTVDAGPEAAAGAARAAGAGVIQLHGDEPPETLRALRDEGDWRLWKAVRIREKDDVVAALERWAEVADGLLLDGFRAGRAGGSGTAFPWEALEGVRTQVPQALMLVVAGGLTPENVAEAVRRLSPDVVDVSSGVEAAPGSKDPERIRSFVERARAGGGTGSGSGSASGPRSAPRARPRALEVP
jgi:phosphoribosylanthranilate isomerase